MKPVSDFGMNMFKIGYPLGEFAHEAIRNTASPLGLGGIEGGPQYEGTTRQRVIRCSHWLILRHWPNLIVTTHASIERLKWLLRTPLSND